MNPLPQPLTPADCDLRDFKFMPLDVVRLRDSDIATVSEGDEFRCAVLLWCASWHQVPAASLPDDDKLLAQYAGFGRVVKEWVRVRNGALRGWVKCSDGRLYHPVVAEKANESWLAKLRQRLKTECGRIKKHNERHGTKIPFPDFDDWLAAGCPTGQALPVPGDNGTLSQGQTANVASDNSDMSQGQDAPVASENHSKGQIRDRDRDREYIKPIPETPSLASTVVGTDSATCSPAQLTAAMRPYGINANPGDMRIVALASQGVTVASVQAACEKAKQTKPSESIPPGYVFSILEAWAKKAKEMNVQGAKPPSTRNDQARDLVNALTGNSHEQRPSDPTIIDLN